MNIINKISIKLPKLLLATAICLSSPTSFAQKSKSSQKVEIKDKKEDKFTKKKKAKEKKRKRKKSRKKRKKKQEKAQSEPDSITLKTKFKLTPELRTSIKKNNKSFKRCQREAIDLMKKTKISKKKMKMRVNACREQFPGTTLYINCKRKVLKQFSGNRSQAKAQLKQCKKFLVAASYIKENPIPFFIHKEKMYFAGIAMNKSLPASSFTLPNFDCSKLLSKAKNSKTAEHILFGNHPAWFKGLSGRTPKQLLALTGLTLPISEDGAYVKGFGRVFGDPGKPGSSVYFPSSSCVFSGQLGDNFTGLTAYYLIDEKSAVLTPHFGIAFFKSQEKDTKITKNFLIKSMIDMLGEGYGIAHQTDSFTAIAASGINNFDAEGDPKDLCNTSRKHKYVAILKTRLNSNDIPEYLLIANIKKLCKYGDRLSRRL